MNPLLTTLGKSPVFWGTLGVGAGAAVCLLFLGRPEWWSFVWSQSTAAWVSGAATVAAVWIAITASRNEHRRTIRLRDEAWERDDQARRDRAATLAHAFHRELLGASRELQFIILMTSPTQQWEHVRSFIAEDMTRPPLPLITRFADQLDVFKAEDAVAILNALYAWRLFQEPIPQSYLTASSERVWGLAEKIRIRASETNTMYRELQDVLFPYFQHFEGLKMVEDAPLPGLAVGSAARHPEPHT